MINLYYQTIVKRLVKNKLKIKLIIMVIPIMIIHLIFIILKTFRQKVFLKVFQNKLIRETGILLNQNNH
jgi:hypothetical protein